jgi:glycosyltransferase involved in cell wall biosynthesis
MIELVRRLDPARWSVHLACFRARGAWFHRIARSVESVAEFPVESFKRFTTLKHLRAFSRWCRERQVALVHTTELYSNIFGLPGAALAGVPVRIGNRRGMNTDKGRGLLALQRAAYSCADIVIANSRAAAVRLMEERVPAHKITVIPNGLDLEAHQPRSTERPTRRVAVVANLRPGKGHETLIDAAVEILRGQPDATFEVIGDGSERKRLIALADRRQVRHAFTFVGQRDDVPARLAEADIFVLPSLSEALPNAVLEAMAAGLPVVTSEVGGIPELISDDRTGLLVPPGDAAALAAALLRVMNETGLAARLGQAARVAAETHYSFDRMVTAFDACYTSALAGRPVAAVEPLDLLAS